MGQEGQCQEIVNHQKRLIRAFPKSRAADFHPSASFRRKPESRRFHNQIVLQQQAILDSRESGNDGNGEVSRLATQFDDTP